MTERKLLTRIQKAQELRISYRTLSKWIRANKIQWFTVKGSKRKWFEPNI